MSIIVKSYRKEREKEITDSLRMGMEKAVLIVENQAKRNVSKTGMEHPQVQTGELRSSINSNVKESGNEIIGEVGTNVKHGKYLELGTYKMPPYSWLFPALEMKKDDIVQALKGRSIIIT